MHLTEETNCMILRHAREPLDNQPIENSFEAIDERSGAQLGGCTIFVHENPELFPNRPVRIYMEIQGEPAPDALLGASVARAKEIAQECGAPSRIFTQVEPSDEARMASLAALGFRDTDGLVCMRRELYTEATPALPIGCVVVKDDLDDPIEQKFFLERYNQLYNENYDFEWLQDLRANDHFQRILIVAPTGMAGEAITWHENGVGRINWLFTARKWRNKGVAKCLLELACAEFCSAGLRRAECEVQARIPGMLRLMESAGFRQAELILRYPGMDIG